MTIIAKDVWRNVEVSTVCHSLKFTQPSYKLVSICACIGYLDLYISLLSSIFSYVEMVRKRNVTPSQTKSAIIEREFLLFLKSNNTALLYVGNAASIIRNIYMFECKVRQNTIMFQSQIALMYATTNIEMFHYSPKRQQKIIIWHYTRYATLMAHRRTSCGLPVLSFDVSRFSM